MSTRLQLMPLISNFAKYASETVGARHLEDEVCSAATLPAPANAPPGVVVAYTQGCGGETMFALPVTGDEGSDLKLKDPARVCVVDDMAYMFPRYGGDDWAHDPLEEE